METDKKPMKDVSHRHSMTRCLRRFCAGLLAISSRSHCIAHRAERTRITEAGYRAIKSKLRSTALQFQSTDVNRRLHSLIFGPEKGLFWHSGGFECNGDILPNDLPIWSKNRENTVAYRQARAMDAGGRLVPSREKIAVLGRVTSRLQSPYILPGWTFLERA